MATIGNNRMVYITTSSALNKGTWLEGETSNSFSRSAETIEVTDKSSKWKSFLTGQLSATAEVSVNLDNSATAQQHSLLTSFVAGTTVFCFIGEMGSNGEGVDGDAFEAVITAINDTNDKNAAASRSISLQVTGAPTHYPAV